MLVLRALRTRNIIAACVLLAVAAVYAFLTSRLPARTLPNTPDPSFFPWLNSAALAALSAALLVQGLRLPRACAAIGKRSMLSWEAAAALGGFLVYLAVLSSIGFVEASVPLFLFLMVLYGERRWGWLLAGSVGVPLALYVLFRDIFGVLLPSGPLSGLLG